MAGYSGTPLVQKIGLKPGHRLVLRNHPPGFLGDLGTLPDGTTTSGRLAGRADVVICFVERRAVLEKSFPALARGLEPDGMLWIAWPKKASGRPTDLNENLVRDIGLAIGLVDVKVCAIDEVWSGLKFVIRLKNRPKTRDGPAAKRHVTNKEQ